MSAAKIGENNSIKGVSGGENTFQKLSMCKVKGNERLENFHYPLVQTLRIAFYSIDFMQYSSSDV